MALFGRKPKEDKEEKVVAATSPTPAVASAAHGGDISHVLRTPRITEKASMHHGGGIYAFDVALGATKPQIAQAVRALYGVVPQKVRVVRVPTKEKRNMRTGARSVTRGGKKAYVYLKKGETITIT